MSNTLEDRIEVLERHIKQLDAEALEQTRRENQRQMELKEAFRIIECQRESLEIAVDEIRNNLSERIEILAEEMEIEV